MRKWDLGTHVKTLEVGRSQALIVKKNCVRISSDEHRHKIDFHLAKFRVNVRAGRDPNDSQVAVGGPLGQCTIREGDHP